MVGFDVRVSVFLCGEGVVVFLVVLVLVLYKYPGGGGNSFLYRTVCYTIETVCCGVEMVPAEGTRFRRRGASDMTE